MQSRDLQSYLEAELPVLNLNFLQPPQSGKWQSNVGGYEAALPVSAIIGDGYVSFVDSGAKVSGLKTNPIAIVILITTNIANRCL